MLKDLSLASQARRVVAALSSSELSQLRWALQTIGSTHGVGDRPIPVKLRLNRNTGRPTDLRKTKEFRSLVAEISIKNALDAQELLGLERRFGEAGRHAKSIVIDTLSRYLQARIAATDYKPKTQSVNGHRYDVHSSVVQLRKYWDSRALKDVQRALLNEGLFALNVPNSLYGLAYTSSSKTNPDMMRQWVLDSMMAGLIQRRRSPLDWRRSMITNSGFHITEPNLGAALRTIRRPAWYRDGDAERGMAHIYLPEPMHREGEGLRWDESKRVPALDSILEDPAWGNRKRLESQAKFVIESAETILAGCGAERRKFGFDWSQMSKEQKRYVVLALQTTMSYLLAVQWNGQRFDHRAPSVSSWEEAPHHGGCTSDSGYMIDAARSVKKLLFTATETSGLREIRAELRTISNWQLREALERSKFADFRNQEVLNQYIEAGEKLLARRVLHPILAALERGPATKPEALVFTGIKQFENRGPDSSLALLAAHYSSFSENGYIDALTRYGIVRFLGASLLGPGPRGMIRYDAHEVVDEDNNPRVVFDSYLSRDFHPALILTPLFVEGVTTFVNEQSVKIHSYGVPPEALSLPDRIVLEAEERLKAADKQFKSQKDAQSMSAMVARQHLSHPSWTAQWSIAPTACLIALAKAKLRLLEHMKLHGQAAESLALYNALNRELDQMLNLVLSTLVGETDSKGNQVYRADGTPVPARLNTMEAFQVVLDLNGNPVWLPGEHTLPWSSAQIYEALRLAIRAEEQAKKQGLNR